MDDSMITAALWIGAGVVLVLYLMRRKKRRTMR
jgi:LPXTG-motif cell wall-anchored protein